MKDIIIVEESGSFEFYKSIDAAILDLEPIDVSNGRYKVYDCYGHLLSLDVITKNNLSFPSRILGHKIKQIIIVTPENSRDLSIELAEKLKFYFADFTDRFNYNGNLESAPLCNLIEHGLQYFSARYS